MRNFSIYLARFSLFVVAIALHLIVAALALSGTWSNSGNAGGGFPGAHAGGLIVMMGALVAAAWGVAFSLSGIGAILKGIVLGIVLNALLDFALRKNLWRQSFLGTMRTCAAFAVSISLIFILIRAYFYPLLTQLGSTPSSFMNFTNTLNLISSTGFQYWIFGSVIGLIIAGTHRVKKQKKPSVS